MGESPKHTNEPQDYRRDAADEYLPGSLSANSEDTRNQSHHFHDSAENSDNKYEPSGVKMGWWNNKWQWLKEPKNSNALLVVFSGLLLIATSIYAIFAALQWREMKTQRQIAMYQLGEPLVWPSKWMGIYHNRGNHKVWAALRIQNDGKTAAEFIHVAAHLQFRTRDPEHADYVFSSSDFKETIPNKLRPFSIAGDVIDYRLELAQEISPEEYTLYKDWHFYVWGKIRSVDLTGESIETPFCRYAVSDIFDKAKEEGYGEPYNDCHPQ